MGQPAMGGRGKVWLLYTSRPYSYIHDLSGFRKNHFHFFSRNRLDAIQLPKRGYFYSQDAPVLQELRPLTLQMRQTIPDLHHLQMRPHQSGGAARDESNAQTRLEQRNPRTGRRRAGKTRADSLSPSAAGFRASHPPSSPRRWAARNLALRLRGLSLTSDSSGRTTLRVRISRVGSSLPESSRKRCLTILSSSE